MNQPKYIGPYHIIHKIASGGMADVFLATYQGSGDFLRWVCIKSILEHLQKNTDFVEMFYDEACISANLVHSNIAQIYDIVRDGTHVFMVMEYLKGKDLRRVYNAEAEQGRLLNSGVAAYIMMKVASGLHYAHQQKNIHGQPLNVVHRDISPQNIIITYDGSVKVIDFGVAKASGKLIETRAGVLKGKYAYMSPEQANREAIDARSDIFSMGTTLYEIITGSRLFKRDSEIETLQAVIACQITPPEKINPNIDKELSAIILKALASRPEQRFQTAEEFEAALDDYLWNKRFHINARILSAYMQHLFANTIEEESKLITQAIHSQEILSNKPKTSDTPPTLALQNRTTILAESPLSHLRNTHAETVQLDPEPIPPESTASKSQWSSETPVGEDAIPLQEAWKSDPMIFNDRWGFQYFWFRWRYIAGIFAFITILFLWSVVRLMRKNSAGSKGAQTSLEEKTDKPQTYGHLDVIAPVKMTVHALEDNALIGSTPIRGASLKSGQQTLLLTSDELGWSVKIPVLLNAGTRTFIKVPNHRGELLITADPSAWVSFGTQPQEETPVQKVLYSGEYTVRIYCSEQEIHLVRLTVNPKKSQQYHHTCNTAQTK